MFSLVSISQVTGFCTIQEIGHRHCLRNDL